MNVENWNYDKGIKIIIWNLEFLDIGYVFLNFNMKKNENIFLINLSHLLGST